MGTRRDTRSRAARAILSLDVLGSAVELALPPLRVNAPAALPTGLLLLPFRRRRLQSASSLVLEHDCMALDALSGGVKALPKAVPPKMATAASAADPLARWGGGDEGQCHSSGGAVGGLGYHLPPQSIRISQLGGDHDEARRVRVV